VTDDCVFMWAGGDTDDAVLVDDRVDSSNDNGGLNVSGTSPLADNTLS